MHYERENIFFSKFRQIDSFPIRFDVIGVDIFKKPFGTTVEGPKKCFFSTASLRFLFLAVTNDGYIPEENASGYFRLYKQCWLLL